MHHIISLWHMLGFPCAPRQSTCTRDSCEKLGIVFSFCEKKVRDWLGISRLKNQFGSLDSFQLSNAKQAVKIASSTSSTHHVLLLPQSPNVSLAKPSDTTARCRRRSRASLIDPPSPQPSPTAVLPPPPAIPLTPMMTNFFPANLHHPHTATPLR